MLKIKRIDEFKYVLEENPFYVDGKGGQLGDRGKIGDANIVEITENFIVLDKKLEDGYYCYEIDIERQKDIAQQHSAQHIFSAEAYNKFSLNTVGFRMGEEYSTVDLDSKEITKETIVQLEEFVNVAINKDIQVEEMIYTNSEAHKLTNLRKQIKEKIKGDVRFIKISDIDICACAGFHVNKTSEIKIFKIIGTEVIRGTWTRFFFLAGNRAVNDYNFKHGVTKRLSNIFSCKTDEILEMLDKSLKEKERIEYEYKNLSYKYAENLAKELEKNCLEYENKKIVIYNENKNISDILPRYINLNEYVLFSGFDKNYTFVSNVIDCQKVIKKIIQNYPEIKGGGSPKKGNLKLDKIYEINELEKIIKKSIQDI